MERGLQQRPSSQRVSPPVPRPDASVRTVHPDPRKAPDLKLRVDRERGQPHFAEEGPTHVDLEAGTSTTFGAFTVSPVVHFCLPLDRYARVAAPGEEEGRKLTFGMTLGWARE